MDQVFQEIYTSGTWGPGIIPGIRGGSGGGSDPNAALPYFKFLVKFMKDHEIKSVMDLGCGDWQFSRFIDWTGIDYTGVDCVAPVVAVLDKQFGSKNVKFSCFDFSSYSSDIVSADLCIMKDVLQHWPDEAITMFLKTIIEKQLFKYILITNCCDQQHIRDCPVGGWAALNPTMFPLKEFNPEVVLEYGTKKTCLIRT